MGVGTDVATLGDRCASAERNARIEGHIAGELNGGIYPGAAGIDHGDTPLHPVTVGAVPQLRLGGGKLNPIVDLFERLGRKGSRLDRMTTVRQDPWNISQEMSPGSWIGQRPPDCRGEKPAANHVHPGADLYWVADVVAG